MPYNSFLNNDPESYALLDYSYWTVSKDMSLMKDYTVRIIASFGDITNSSYSPLYYAGDEDDGEGFFLSSNGDLTIFRYVNSIYDKIVLAGAITENGKIYEISARFKLDEISITVGGVSSAVEPTPNKRLGWGTTTFTIGGALEGPPPPPPQPYVFVPSFNITLFRIEKHLDEDITTFLANPGGWDKTIWEFSANPDQTGEIIIEGSSTEELPLSAGAGIRYAEFFDQDVAFIAEEQSILEYSIYTTPDSSAIFPDFSSTDWKIYIMLSTFILDDPGEYKILLLNADTGHIKVTLVDDEIYVESSNGGSASFETARFIPSFERFLITLEKDGDDLNLYVDEILNATVDLSTNGIASGMNGLFIGGDPNPTDKVKRALYYSLALEHS